MLSRATTWLDTGTHESLYEAGGLIRTLQHRNGLRIGDVEQIGRDQGWIATAVPGCERPARLQWRHLLTRSVSCPPIALSTPSRRVLADLVPASLLADVTLVVGAAALVGLLAQVSISPGPSPRCP